MAHGLTLSEVASVVAKLKMYPYFDVANYILMTMMVREDAHPPPTSGITTRCTSETLSHHPRNAIQPLSYSSIILSLSFTRGEGAHRYAEETRLQYGAPIGNDIMENRVVT